MTKARTTPGHIVSRRLAGRSHTRASVGPRSDFFHRLGMQDPFALSSSDDRSDRSRSDLSTGNPFVFLRSAAYAEEVEAARYRLLQRLQGSRETERLGERLERVGPVAVGVRPADSVLFGGMSILEMPAAELDETAEVASAKPRYATWPERRVAAPKRASQARVRPHARHRQVAPMARAFSRAPRPVAPSRFARAVNEIAGDLRGPIGNELIDLTAAATRSPTPDRVESALRRLRQLRGVDGVRAREALSTALSDVGERPIDQARGRHAAPGEAPERGLKRLLASSPALTVMEAPGRAAGAEPTAEVAPAGRAVGQRAPSSLALAPRTRSEPSRVVAPSRRPTGRVARRGVLSARAAATEVSRGPASVRQWSAASPALARADRRRASGVVNPSAAAPLSGAATSWLRPLTSSFTEFPPARSRNAGTLASAASPRVGVAPRGSDPAPRPSRVNEGEFPRGASSASTARLLPRGASSASTARLFSRDARMAPRITASPVAPSTSSPVPAAVLGRGVAHSPGGPSSQPAALYAAVLGRGVAHTPGGPSSQPAALYALARGSSALDRGAAAWGDERLSASPIRFSPALDPLSFVLPHPREVAATEDGAALASARPVEARAAEMGSSSQQGRAAARRQPATSGFGDAPTPRRHRLRRATPPVWRASRRADVPARADGTGRSRLRASPTAHVPSASMSRPRPPAAIGSVARAAARSLTLPRLGASGERLLAPALPAVLVAARRLVQEIERSVTGAESPRSLDPRPSSRAVGVRHDETSVARPHGSERARTADEAPAVGPMLRAAARSVEDAVSDRLSRAPLSRSPLTWLASSAADTVPIATKAAPEPVISDTAVVRPGREGSLAALRRSVAGASTERAEQRGTPAVRLDRFGRALAAPVALSHLATRAFGGVRSEPPMAPRGLAGVAPGRAATGARPVSARRLAAMARTRVGRGALAPSARPLARTGDPPSGRLPRSLVPRRVVEGDLGSLISSVRPLGRTLQGRDFVLPEPEVERTEVKAAVGAALRAQRSVAQVDAVRRAATESVRDRAEGIQAAGVRGRVRQRRSTVPELGAERVEWPEALARPRPAAWAEVRGDTTVAEDVPATRAARRWAEPGAAPTVLAPRLEAPVGLRASSVGLGPMTLASLPSQVDGDAVGGDASSPAIRLRGTLGRLAAEHTETPRTQAAERRLRRNRSSTVPSGTLLGRPETDASGSSDSTAARGALPPGARGRPGWARRAVGRGADVPARDLPLREARVQTMGRLLGALARSGDPDEIVKVVLESSGSLEAAAADLPNATRAMVERLIRAADDKSREGIRATRLQAVQARVLSKKSSAASPSSAGGGEPSSGGGGGDAARATGASGVMRLAGKLMKLIHLAERERKAAEAERQVRMSEETGNSRAEAGAGQAGGENDDKKMNIKALRQDVLEAVLRELENIRWRREDPDGPSIWC